MDYKIQHERFMRKLNNLDTTEYDKHQAIFTE